MAKTVNKQAIAEKLAQAHFEIEPQIRHIFRVFAEDEQEGKAR